MKKDFYRLDNILSKNAVYNILLGERANGKSYAVKEHCLKQAFELGNISCSLVRRLDEDIKQSVISDYFNDEGLIELIKKLSDGKYNCVQFYQRKFYFSHFDEEKNKFTKGFPFCVVFALSNAERYKSSTVYPTMETIIYEEFTTEKLYLRNEVDKFMNFCSTLFRLKTGRVFMIANKVSRVCPYFNEWTLKGIPQMKPGQLDEYLFKTLDGDDVKICVEMCASPTHSKSGMFFGKNAKVISGGEWETHEHPHIQDDLSNYDILYQLTLKHMDFSFNILLLNHIKEEYQCVYVYPSGIKVHDRILTEEYSTSRLVSPCLDSRNRAECLIADLVTRNKLVFPTNLIGEDFYTIIKNMNKSPFMCL